MSTAEHTPGKTLLLGADHAGFSLKEQLKNHLTEKGFTVIDVGCHDTQSVDYPHIAETLITKLLQEKYPLDDPTAILCCGSGVGMSMAANRYPGIRAVLGNQAPLAQWSRHHNNSNVLCLGGRVVAPALACEIIDLWLNTPFEGGRHQKRVQQLDHISPVSSTFEEASSSCSI